MSSGTSSRAVEATCVVATVMPMDSPRVVAVSDAGIWVDTADRLTRLTGDLHVRAVYDGLGC
jgi:hypothetical protein